MKKETICQLLYEGQLDFARGVINNNLQYTKSNAEYCKSVDELYKTLDDEQKELYNDISNKLVDREDSLIHRAFKLGLKFAIELLDELKDVPLDFKVDNI